MSNDFNEATINIAIEQTKIAPNIEYLFISSVAQQGLVELKDLIWKNLA